MRYVLKIVILISMFGYASPLSAATIHVPADQPTIQAGIDIAQAGDTVLVADGIYKGAGNKNLDFNGKPITVKSENGPAKSIIDCERKGAGFYFHNGEGSQSSLIGFTIKNSGPLKLTEGGEIPGTIICREGSSPSIINCVVAGNKTSGINCWGSSPTISNCTIKGNFAEKGGGIICDGNSCPIITGCTIKGNSASMGGGIFSCFYSSPIVIGCTISDNSGGGICCYSSSIIITNCTIIDNLKEPGVRLENSSSTITNCLIARNLSDGIYSYASPVLTINSTTLSNNSGFGIGGGTSSEVTVVNSILFGNSTDKISKTNFPNLTVRFSLVRGGMTGVGNIDVDPAFVNAIAGDYHLKNYSPCIGSATLENSPTTDIEGNARPSPAESNPDMGAYENSRGIRVTPPLDFFGIEVGNEKLSLGTNKDGSYIRQAEVVGTDQTTFPVTTYIVENQQDNSLLTKDWYEKKSNELRWWGGLDIETGDFIKCVNSLLIAWNPMNAGESKNSSTTFTLWGVQWNISLKVSILSKERVSLSFGKLEAFKVKYEQRLWNKEFGEDNYSWFEWVVPYIGSVKLDDGEVIEKLTSFAIGAATITHATDADLDGLPDYQELLTYKTNWLYPDTDHDAMPDKWEIENGLDPLKNDALADTDGDGFSNLREFHAGTDPRDPISHPAKGMPWIPLLLSD